MSDQPTPQEQPAAPWAAQPSTRPGPMPGWHYAGFWVRFLAFILDGIVLGVISAALSPLWGGGQFSITGTTMTVNYGGSALSTLVGLVYFIGFWAWRGQTVGMMPFNMQVVSVADGNKIDVVRGLLRYVGIIIAVIPLFLGLIWAAFDARKQGWHDKIAGTLVIRPN